MLLGNELSGDGVGARIGAEQYASDTTALFNMLHEIYKNVEPKPLTIAPGGFFDANWFQKFIAKSGKSLDVVTHHIYNLGPGNLLFLAKFHLEKSHPEWFLAWKLVILSLMN